MADSTIVRGSGTQEDPFLFKNYEEFKNLMKLYALTAKYKYYTFDSLNATDNDRESFDFNNISETGLFNTSFIACCGVIDFKNLIIKNLYKQTNSYKSFRNIDNGNISTDGTFIYCHGTSCQNLTILNLKLYNFNLTGGTLIDICNPSSYIIFKNCEFSGLIRNDGSSTELKLIGVNNSTSNLVFVNCSFNLNIKLNKNAVAKYRYIFYGDAYSFLINSTVRITGYDNTESDTYALRIGSLCAIGTKFFGNYKICRSSIRFYNRDINFEGNTITNGPNIFDMDIEVSKGFDINNTVTVVNSSKIVAKEGTTPTITFSDPNYVLQSITPGQSDYIYNLQNLENLGFSVAEEVD